MHRQSPCNAPSPMSAGPPPKTSQPGVLDRRGARAWGHEARPPARFSSLSSHRTVNQEQEPWGNTLLAQRTRFAGNSYFWRTALQGAVLLEFARAYAGVASDLGLTPETVLLVAAGGDHAG